MGSARFTQTLLLAGASSQQHTSAARSISGSETHALGVLARETMRSMDTEQKVAIGLTEDERSVLFQGLAQWGGPATGTEAIAMAIGLNGASDFYRDGFRIAADIRSDPPTIAD